SLVNESVVKRFAAISVSPVTLMNPLSEDQRVMTPHLLDGMLKSISWNINRGTCDLRFFEIGKKYSVIEDARQYREIPALCVGFTGFIRNNWAEGKRAVTFFDVKGVIEALFASLRLVPKFKQSLVEGILAPSAVISVDGEDVGFIGEVTGKVLKDYGVEQPVFVSEIKLDRLYEKASLMDMYKALSKFPFSSRDMSILCDKTVTAADMYDVILVAGTELVKDIRLVDVYEGDKIPSGKKSLTYSVTYGLDNRTLNDAEVESMHARIKSALSEKLGVTFR
ncbi:MAG TPA: hypothetical protein PKG81_06855, partial [Candidatus Omnitrophota bacterium]|nr:hypothetical protein [Candidatus Omnitrophota bacterium]